MLYSPTQFARDQLLADLLAAKARLEAGWVKGSFESGESVCIVAAVQKSTGNQLGFTHLPRGVEAPAEVRLGRAILAVYRALLGPKAPMDVTLSHAMQTIARFNDSVASHASVLLLLDRAVAYVQEQATATVTASA